MRKPSISSNTWGRRTRRGSALADVIADRRRVRDDRLDEPVDVVPFGLHGRLEPGLAPGVSSQGDQVFTYGNSIVRGGITVLSPKSGLSLGDFEGTGGWSQDVYTVTPGIPGDSGSGYMDANGNALGVLSTVQLAPLAASNGVGTLAKELAYANTVTGLGLSVAKGTTPFSAVPVPPAA